LEELSEEIRRMLAALPPPGPPALPPIPPVILARIAEYNQGRAAFIEELSQRLREAGLQAADDLPPTGDRAHRTALARQRRLEVQRKAASTFLHENQERYNELRQRYEDLVLDLTTLAEDLTDPETGRQMTVEGLLRIYNIAMQRFEALGREDTMYVNYRIAMLEPGLSPEQRRLLFGAAVVGLAQPLPDGEPMPVGRRMRISR
jgi:hypothetical protein